ncbi:spectrin alpha chain, non-erythrocytic 1-like [Centruroides sculpturatus]|uniref:spectrin alpha chain, non-erythrocytic 1-like n=1 Tax=Centruroides sculpturatus TaxID=218467 RepID=UPI000C6E63B6|nr:spectrin alpha chain, non-erythrocytic 1-like [Centruroides sculpturatus]
MILIHETNADWWNVRKANGQDGFVPANYVKLVEPKIVRKVVKQPVKVPEKQRVKKTVLKKKVIKRKKDKSPEIKRTLSRSSSKPEEGENVKERQNVINVAYEHLVKLSQERRLYLEDAICLFGFYRECDDFEAWMKDKEKMLTTEDPNDSVEVMKKKFEVCLYLSLFFVLADS